jgi:hypothetical protein
MAYWLLGQIPDGEEAKEKTIYAKPTARNPLIMGSRRIGKPATTLFPDNSRKIQSHVTRLLWQQRSGPPDLLKLNVHFCTGPPPSNRDYNKIAGIQERF